MGELSTNKHVNCCLPNDLRKIDLLIEQTKKKAFTEILLSSIPQTVM
jgi:hypothetical protein